MTITHERVTIGATQLVLAEVDRVAYWISRRRMNNRGYPETTFWVKLAAGSKSATFSMDGGARDQRLDEVRDTWRAIVAILESTVTEPFIQRSISKIDNGGTVAFRGLGNCSIDRRGLWMRRPFSKPISWTKIGGWTYDDGTLRLLVRPEPHLEPKKRLHLGMNEWNLVALPSLINHYMQPINVIPIRRVTAAPGFGR